MVACSKVQRHKSQPNYTSRVHGKTCTKEDQLSTIINTFPEMLAALEKFHLTPVSQSIILYLLNVCNMG